MSAQKVLVRNEDGSTSLVASSAGTGGAGGATGSTAPGFTGTTPTEAEAEAFVGTGFATAGQVVTTTGNQTMTVDQCKGMWLITATQPPCLIIANTAVVGAPAVLTVFGLAPTTAAEDYKILRSPTPAGNVASHTHDAGTLTGPAHTHTITSP